MNNNRHVVCNPDGSWSVKKDKDGPAESVHHTRTQAIRKADKNAKWEQATVFIHNLNGKVQNKHNYQNAVNPVTGY